MPTENSPPDDNRPTESRPDAGLPDDPRGDESVPHQSIAEESIATASGAEETGMDAGIPDGTVVAGSFPADSGPNDTVPVPPAPLGRLLRYALLCGFVGFLVSLRPFAAATLPHILTEDGYSFQGVLEGLPVPRLLDWNRPLIGLLQEYATLNPVLLTLGALLVFGFLWICLLRVRFPTLRLFHAVPEAGTVTIATASTVALNSRLLLRMGSLFCMVVLPLAAMSLGALAIARFPKLALALPVAEFIVAGVWLRIALRRGGFVARKLAPFDPALGRERSASFLWEIVLGAVFGLLTYLLQTSAMRLPSEDVLRSLHALGAFHVARWNALAFHYLLSVSLVCFGIGLLVLILSPFPSRPFAKMLSLILVALCVPLSLRMQRPYSPQSLADHWDITPPIMFTAWPYTPRRPGSGIPDGDEAGKELARRAGISLGKQPLSPDRRFLLFAQAGVFNSLQHGYTEDGLAADPASVRKVEAFLQRREYNTALSWIAFKHVYNLQNVHFDSTAALRTCLNDLERTPHPGRVTRTVREAFFTVAASPQNLALLNEWADEKRFDHGDRDCLKLMGDLYVRFGEQQKALEWYARADMPHSFMATVRANKPLFHAGRILGTVLWNGKPLVGVEIGAFPYLQNGLPKDLEGQVRAAERGLIPAFAFSEKFGPGEPRPYQFRWMSAGTKTDSAGHFTLDHLTEGTYHLVCTLPVSVALTAIRDDRLHIVNAPKDITLRYAKPTSDLGTIALTLPH